MASQTQLGAGNAQKQLKGFKHRDPRFRWQHQINDSSQKLLLEVKEAAVNVAIEHGSRIARHIQTLIQASTSSNTPTTDVAIDELQDWINRYSKIFLHLHNASISLTYKLRCGLFKPQELPDLCWRRGQYRCWEDIDTQRTSRHTGYLACKQRGSINICRLLCCLE